MLFSLDSGFSSVMARRYENKHGWALSDLCACVVVEGWGRTGGYLVCMNETHEVFIFGGLKPRKKWTSGWFKSTQ